MLMMSMCLRPYHLSVCEALRALVYMIRQSARLCHPLEGALSVYPPAPVDQLQHPL